MPASGAKSGFGTLIELSDGGGTPVFTPIAEVVSIKAPGGKRTMIDATHMESPDGCREFIGGLLDRGEVEIGINFINTNATHTDLIANLHQTTAANVFRTYRIVLADGATTFTATVSTTTWTASGAHSWNTVQPVFFTTSGTLPSNVTAGKFYFAKRLSSTTFSIHPTSADAIAGTNAVSSSGGSGTHTVCSGTTFTFSAGTSDFDPQIPNDDKISATVRLKVSGNVTITP